MRKFRSFIILILTLGVVLFYVQPVLAFPPLPSSFNGTVKINGSNAPAGTVVAAWINGVLYKTTTVVYIAPDMKYLLNVPGDDPTTVPIEGGVEGDTVIFYIGTTQATQATQIGTWHSGTNVSLNLTGYTVEPSAFIIFLPVILR
jgi:hypothetical protein